MRPLFNAAAISLFAVLAVGAAPLAAQQPDPAEALWRVSKVSGDVVVTTARNETIAVNSGAVLNPGDSLRTGKTGRVLLGRNQQTILVSPNSVMDLPAEKRSELSTRIIQRAGSILLDVEKRNVNHFEVETPYIAAVVKGTQFSVSLDNTDARVDVLRGQVEVIDLRSGQQALVHTEQSARVAILGAPGLMLSGAEPLSPVQSGAPRAPRVAAAAVGIAAPDAPAVAPPSQDAAEPAGPMDELTLIVAAPTAIGVIVALAVALQRRRRPPTAIKTL